MSAFDSTVELVYLAAAVSFVLGLRLMNSPATARRGNQMSAAGMGIAVLTTVIVLAEDGVITSTGVVVLTVGLVIGSLAGLLGARRVKMTAMPQLVSLFNAVGGGAAALIAFGHAVRHEGWIPLSHAATYLATAPKSNASYVAYRRAAAELQETGTLPVPLHLRNAPTKLMKAEGYAEGYRYPHDFPGHVVSQQYLPDELAGRRYYDPGDEGYERDIGRRLAVWRNETEEE